MRRAREYPLVDFRTAPDPTTATRQMKTPPGVSSGIFPYLTCSHRSNLGRNVCYLTSYPLVRGGSVSPRGGRASDITWEATSSGLYSSPHRRGLVCSAGCTVSMADTARAPTVVQTPCPGGCGSGHPRILESVLDGRTDSSGVPRYRLSPFHPVQFP